MLGLGLPKCYCVIDAMSVAFEAEMASTTEAFVRTPIRPPLSSNTSATVSSASSITYTQTMCVSTQPAFYNNISTLVSMQIMIRDRQLTIPHLTASVHQTPQLRSMRPMIRNQHLTSRASTREVSGVSMTQLCRSAHSTLRLSSSCAFLLSERPPTTGSSAWLPTALLLGAAAEAEPLR